MILFCSPQWNVCWRFNAVYRLQPPTAHSLTLIQHFTVLNGAPQNIQTVPGKRLMGWRTNTCSFCFMQMSLGPGGYACGGPYTSQHGKQLCAFAHFLPHLTHSLAAKQNKIKQKIISRRDKTIVKIIRSNKRENAVKGVVQLGRGRDFRQLVSSMDGLRCGWSCEVKYCTQNTSFAARAGVMSDLLPLCLKYIHICFRSFKSLFCITFIVLTRGPCYSSCFDIQFFFFLNLWLQ